MGTDAICKYLPLVGLSYVKVFMVFYPNVTTLCSGFCYYKSVCRL